MMNIIFYKQNLSGWNKIYKSNKKQTKKKWGVILGCMYVNIFEFVPVSYSVVMSKSCTQVCNDLLGSQSLRISILFTSIEKS